MKVTVLYFYPNLSTFVKKDIMMIETKYKVISYGFLPKRKAYVILSLIRQFFFILFHIGRSKVIICKFASYHSLFPGLFAKAFKRPFILINGGTDCVSFPSINYGNFNKKMQSIFTKWTYKLTSHIVTLHNSLVEYRYQYQDNDYPKQGFAYHIKNLKKPITEIYNGYDSKKWFKSKEKIHNSFITVAYGIGEKKINYLKGIDLIIDLAKRFPDCRFYVIGANRNFIEKYSKDNIVVLPPLQSSELIDYYSKSEFYLQLSISEGFPNSMCEAMLCECIPIGSDVGAISFIINKTGFILKRKNLNLLFQLVDRALNSDREKLQVKARERIMEIFNEEKREKRLLNLIESLI